MRFEIINDNPSSNILFEFFYNNWILVTKIPNLSFGIKSNTKISSISCSGIVWRNRFRRR